MTAITVLAGGVGAARFLRGVVRAVAPEDVTVVVNVADDLDLLGLRVSPDLDTITYTLAGLVDPEQQWGRADERTTVAEELERLGHERWFLLGDRDLALHLHRRAALDAGAPLSRVTADLARAHGLTVRLLPVTDERIETRVRTTDGRDLHFQEWWVRERARPDVAGLEVRGATSARPAPGVIEAVHDADVVLVAPSNPAVSIGPILAVPGIGAALATTPAPIIGVSPIVGGRVVRGMADRLLPALGVEVSAAGVAEHYGARRDGGLLDGWVLDTTDAALEGRVRGLGIPVAVTDTLLDDPGVAERVAATCLELAASTTRATPGTGAR
jgi:LPPG:FO 2-phospho-L-lactate transferase